MLKGEDGKSRVLEILNSHYIIEVSGEFVTSAQRNELAGQRPVVVQCSKPCVDCVVCRLCRRDVCIWSEVV